jgi:hypothetical protein
MQAAMAGGQGADDGMLEDDPYGDELDEEGGSGLAEFVNNP